MVDALVGDGGILELDFQREDEAPVGAALAGLVVDGPGVFGLQLEEQPVAQERAPVTEIDEVFLGQRIRIGLAEGADLAADRGFPVQLPGQDLGVHI
jgi:hypothetical protein